MRCPECGHALIQRRDEKVKLRAPILVFDPQGDQCVTNCPKCKKEIQLPVTLEQSAIPNPTRGGRHR
jgi:predicted RNA-binding Zn-ribbon protein involved in translation (DUF1610 family)